MKTMKAIGPVELARVAGGGFWKKFGKKLATAAVVAGAVGLGAYCLTHPCTWRW